MPFPGRWVELDGIVLREISLAEKDNTICCLWCAQSKFKNIILLARDGDAIMTIIPAFGAEAGELEIWDLIF